METLKESNDRKRKIHEKKRALKKGLEGKTSKTCARIGTFKKRTENKYRVGSSRQKK